MSLIDAFKKKWETSVVRDLVSANTAADQKRRLDAGRPRYTNDTRNIASKGFDQFNPIDSGRTFSNPTPTNTRTGFQQLTHNALTNTIGNLTAPTISSAIVEPARAITGQLTGNREATDAANFRRDQSLARSLPKQAFDQAWNIGAVPVNLAKQTAADITGNEVAGRNANNAVLGNFNRTFLGPIVNMPARNLADYQARRDLPGASKEQQKAVAGRNLERVGYDPKASLGKQVFETGLGVAGAVGATYGPQLTATALKRRPAPPTRLIESDAIRRAESFADVPNRELPREIPTSTGTTDVNARLTQAAQNAKDKYGQPNIIRRTETTVANPTAPLTRIDFALEDAMGIKRGTIPRSQSLEHLADVSQSMSGSTGKRVALINLEKFGINDVIKKYGEGTPAGTEFRNYQNAKHATEVAGKRGLSVLADDTGKKITTKELSDFVADYERRNPEAITDNAKFKAWADSEIDKAITDGRIEAQVGEYVKQFYENYVPIERVLAENMARPTVNASPIGSLGRQKVVQELQGSTIPASTSFDTFVRRAQNLEREAARQNLFSQFKRNTEKGVAPEGTRILQTAEQVKQARELRGLFNELNGIQKSLQNQKAALRGKIGVSKVKTSQAEKALVAKVKKSLRATVDDPDAKTAINSLTTEDIVNISQNMIDSNIPGTWQLTKMFKKNTRARDALTDRLEGMRSDIETLGNAKKTTKEGLLEVATDPTTGKQVVSGFDEGLPVKIEVTPEIATILQGLDQAKMGFLAKTAGTILKPFRSAFTGALNPVFSAISFAFYDAPMGYLNSANGWRTLVSPNAVGQMFKSFSSNSDFQQKLSKGGAQIVTGSLVPSRLEGTAKYIAAQKNLFTKVKYAVNPKNLGQVIEQADILGGKLMGATRTRIAKVAYDDAIRKNLGETDAIANAVYAYNNIMPNYQRTSAVLREIDSVLPYTAASVAGTRAAGQALRRRPALTASKGAVLLAPAVVTTAHNVSSATGQDFYEDMLASGKTHILDNNFVVVLPGASKNERTGEWTGIVKIPIAPEFRQMNAALWRETYSQISKNDITNPATYASAIFDTATGDSISQPIGAARSLMGDKKASSFGGNPALNTLMGLSTNVNPRTGNEIVYEDLKDKPVSEQATGRESGMVKSIASALNMPPAKVQFVVDQFGAGGRLVTGSSTPFEEVEQRLVGAYGESRGKRFFDNVEEVASTIDSPRDKARFLAHFKKDDTPGLLNSATKAQDYLDSPAILEANRELDKRQRAEGLPGNPIFDLSPDQLQKVLVYRQAKMLNAGKQTYDKNGEPLFTSLGLDEPWYDALRDSETGFYDQVKSNKIADLNDKISQAPENEKGALRKELADEQAKTDDDDITTFSGGAKPKASPELQALLDKYYTLPKGTGQRSGMLRAYPEILEYWEASDGFANRERAAIGLKPISEDDSGGFGSFAKRNTGTNPGIASIIKKGGVSLDDLQVKTSTPKFQSKVKKPSGKKAALGKLKELKTKKGG